MSNPQKGPRVSGQTARAQEGVWIIRYATEGVERTIYANGLEPPAPAPAPGDSGSYTFRFYPEPRLETQLEAATHDHQRRHKALLDVAADAAYEIPLELTEQPPVWTNTGRPGSSPLVSLEPYYSTPEPSIWGLIDGVTSDTELPDTLCRATLDVTAIATFEEYGREQRGRLKNDLEYSGI